MSEARSRARWDSGPVSDLPDGITCHLCLRRVSSTRRPGLASLRAGGVWRSTALCSVISARASLRMSSLPGWKQSVKNPYGIRGTGRRCLARRSCSTGRALVPRSSSHTSGAGWSPRQRHRILSARTPPCLSKESAPHNESCAGATRGRTERVTRQVKERRKHYPISRPVSGPVPTSAGVVGNGGI